MDRAQALAHLTSVCVPEASDEAALSEIWAAAKEKLGAPIRGAGSPSIRTLPPAFDSHCRAVLSQAAFRDGGSFSGAFACLVEVAPLLTPQFVVDRSRLAHHSAEAREATLPTALETCLPLTERSEPFQTIAGPQLLLLKSRSMNVKFICGYDDPEILATRKPHAALMALTADTIAATLNARPRKTLGWMTPAEAFDRWLA